MSPRGRCNRRAPGTYHLGPALQVSLVREGGGTVATLRGGVLDAPEAAALELLARIPDDGKERFGVVFLNVRRAPTAIYEISIGCLTASLVHPREVFGPAILAAAASVILFHTHPSGDPEPSTEDLALTRRLASAGQVLGIEVCDHLVLGQGTGRWVSLRERGIL